MRGNQVYTECVRGEEGGREVGEETSTKLFHSQMAAVSRRVRWRDFDKFS